MTAWRILRFPLFAALTLALAASSAAAQDTVAVAYTAQVKSGMMAEFEAAVASHLQWREGNNDPWSWNVYQVVNGDNLNDFTFRSSGHAWADFDSYAAFQAEGAAHFRNVVAPYVESLTSTIVASTDVARWIGSTTRPMYTVQTYQVKPGAMASFLDVGRQFNEALSSSDFGGEFVFQIVRNGGSQGVAMIVSPLDSWADMDPPGPTMQEVLDDTLGEKKVEELWERFRATIAHSESSIVVRRTDLSGS